ncbi:MAG: hypothetical protein ISS56_07705 [Anaerolineae bacterium]|nr:hypothetical protein [Anaerolineae bacterium]
MSEHTYLQEDEMIRRAIEALLRDLGPVEATRFLTLPQRRRMDSVTRHRLWQESLERDRFFDQVFEEAKS